MLPDTDVEIVRENIRAVQAIYFAHAMEELRLFGVVERIAELYAQGLLPLGDRSDAERLRRVALRQQRLSEAERRGLYARALGVPGGDPGEVEPNREFLSLWLRFLVTVAATAEQAGAGAVVAPASASNAAARKAARELAANVSHQGDGIAHFVADELAQQVRDDLELLARPEVRTAFGGHDAWQVIDRVNRHDLGGARDIGRYRTQAVEGGRVLQWLAEHYALLNDDGAGAPADEQAALVEAVERLLAVSGAAAGAADRAAPEEGAGADPNAAQRRIADDLLDAINAARPRGPADRGRVRDVVLFEGGRGTGKTLAAYQIAQALGLELVRVDLGEVVSKYIGETEKHLGRLFDRARDAGAVLFFDEADALFGARSEVKDAHDRYANQVLEWLRQRVAAHEGPVIIATAAGIDIDAAFPDDDWKRRRLRRVRFPRRPPR
jgi:hypothetical protein